MKCRLKGLVGGLDEAGRAPLAGPVVSSCVVWDGLPPVREEVNDSKLLTEKERERFFGWIVDHAYKVTVGLATSEEIEQLNIHHASLLSMERAVKNTKTYPTLLIVDGLFPLPHVAQSKAVVKGDRKCFFVACASIVAKVVRDRIMTAYDSRYPQYGWKKNKGYPTAEHRKAIETYGISPLHRRTFRGVREYDVSGREQSGE
jgi:ribonuclease HII